MTHITSKRRIGIDIDGVLSETVPALLEFHNNRYGTTLKKDQIHAYELWKSWGGTLEDDIEKFYSFYESEYFAKIEPVDGAMCEISKLANENELIVITSRPHDIAKKTHYWIETWFPNLFKEFHFTNQTSRKGIKGKKSHMCNNYHIQVLIDDHVDFLKECVEGNSGVQTILFDSPWNQNESLPTRISRAYSWKEITGLISRI